MLTCSKCGSPYEDHETDGVFCLRAQLAVAEARMADVAAERNTAAKLLGEARQEIAEVRCMFDVTRHRVLAALGETDMGKGWFHVDGLLAARDAEIATRREERNQAIRIARDLVAWAKVTGDVSADAVIEAENRLAVLTRDIR